MAVRLLTGSNDLGTTHPAIALEWASTNDKMPTQVVAGSTYRATWLCPSGHEYKAAVRNRTKRNQGCPYCAGQKAIPGVNDLATVYPSLAAEWSSRNDLAASDVLPGSGKKVWWKCLKGHEWEEIIELRGKRGYGCPYCSGHRVDDAKSLAAKYPEVMREWDSRKNTVSPHDLSYASHVLTWWTCEQGHSWRTATYNRTIYSKNCPVCAGQSVQEGVNDLASQHPDVAAEFDCAKNQVTPDTVHVGSNLKYWWICDQGHSWEAPVSSRTREGTQCRHCSRHAVSRAEDDICETIEQWGHVVERNRRDLISPYEIDLYLPELKIGIEFNGLIWHSEKYNSNKLKHFQKWSKAHDQGITLIQVWEDDWNERRDIVLSSLRTKLSSQSIKIGARQTTVVMVPSAQAVSFLDQNHIQGSVKGCKHYGLMYKGDLVAVMSIKHTAQAVHLERFATSVRVVGGFTKLLRVVRSDFPDLTVVTFADLCISNGNLYVQHGFSLEQIIPPDYMYLVKNRREHKFNYRLRRFKDDDSLVYREGMTEHELALANGLYRVYDAGKAKFVLNADDDSAMIAGRDKVQGY